MIYLADSEVINGPSSLAQFNSEKLLRLNSSLDGTSV